MPDAPPELDQQSNCPRKNKAHRHKQPPVLVSQGESGRPLVGVVAGGQGGFCSGRFQGSRMQGQQPEQRIRNGRRCIGQFVWVHEPKPRILPQYRQGKADQIAQERLDAAGCAQTQAFGTVHGHVRQSPFGRIGHAVRPVLIRVDSLPKALQIPLPFISSLLSATMLMQRSTSFLTSLTQAKQLLKKLQLKTVS